MLTCLPIPTFFRAQADASALIEELEEDETPSAAQLSYLKKLGATKAVLELLLTKENASDLIDELKSRQKNRKLGE